MVPCGSLTIERNIVDLSKAVLLLSKTMGRTTNSVLESQVQCVGERGPWGHTNASSRSCKRTVFTAEIQPPGPDMN